MIYTITCSPAIDYVMNTQNFTINEINRSSKERFKIGGKGINVSHVLNNFNVKSVATGFVGGFSGDYIVKKLNKAGIQNDFVYVNEPTRINIKINQDNKESAINAAGPIISKDHFKELIIKISSFTSDDFVVISGNISRGLEQSTYEEIAAILHKNNVPFAVDATNELLKRSLKYQPTIIKPNIEELQEIVHFELNTKEKIYQAVKLVQNLGVKNVLLSAGKNGCYLFTPTTHYYQKALKGEVVSTVGAGDSLLAGYILGKIANKNDEETLKYANQIAATSVFNDELATPYNLQKILEVNDEN